VPYNDVMVDLIFVALLFGLFGLTALFIGVCDRMIGADDDAFAGAPSGSARADDARVAA
jgi:hypothetical protein